MKTKTGKILMGGKTVVSLLAVVLALGAATTAEAAKNWTGSSSGNFSTSGNWGGNNSGRRYFKKENLSGNKIDRIYLSANVTETSNTGLCFDNVPDRGYWRLRSSTPSNIYTFDNSGNSSDYDQDLICIGYEGRGSSAHFYGIKLKTRHLTVGGHSTLGGHNILKKDMTGHLVLAESEINDDNNLFFGPVTITTTKTCDFYKGDIFATNANITCQGDMMLYTFTVDKTGGDWTMTGDFKIGLGSGTATVIQRSGTFLVPAGKWTRFESGSTSTLKLNGGTFKTRRITNQGAVSASVILDGGSIEVNGDASNYGLIDATVDVRVGANGGTINTGGRTFHVPAAINAVGNTTGAFAVTGGGAVTFQNRGNLAGALAVGDNTTLHWFDQDGAVSATCGFTSLALGAGSTIYLDGDATSVDALPATATTTATAGSKANIVINFSAIPATGASFTLFPAASADVFNVSPMAGSLVLPNEVAVVNGNLVLTIVAEDYTWNSSQTNWGDTDAWTKGGAVATWADGNNAIFNAANATATLAADASPAKIEFTANAMLDGTATLTVPVVSAVPGVSATISAPTAGLLTKAGAGTLTLGSSRTEQTTVSEGTLAMAAGATVDPAKLTLGTDSATPVTFDYGGQTLTADPRAYVSNDADVTFKNGVFTWNATIWFNATILPSALTIGPGATMQTSEHLSFNTTDGAETEMTVNVAGGVLKSTKNDVNWFMQTSLDGRLNINVTDGGLLELGGESYMLTCRDTVNGSTDYQSPSLYMKVVDSTLRVLNGKSLRLGRDDNNKNASCPTLVFAATNSVIDLGFGLYVGNSVIGANTAGSYTVDFENCTITAREVRVYQDRPLNAVRFNNTRYVVNNGSDSYTLESASAFETLGEGGAAIKPITIDAGGLVIDSNGKNCALQADPQGSGAITKAGSGKLTILRSQSSSSGLVCAEGETYLNAGLTIARPVTVESNATFTVKATAQSAISSLTFESGATLNIDTPTFGVTPLSVTTLSFPANGTVALKKSGGAFGKGLYPIVERVGVTTADAANLVPETSNLPYEWIVQGNALVLAVDMGLTGFVWTGLAGDGKMSTGGNWLNGTAPSAAGTDLDFSSVISATTVIGDIDVTFGAVTMGDGIVTFTNAFTATSISNTLKVTVGADSTVTIEGDLLFEGDGSKYAVYRVENGGAFIVTGRLGKAAGASGNFYPQSSVGGGIVIGGELVNNGDSGDIYACVNLSSQKWAVGPGGITGTLGWWCLADAKNSAYFYPYTNDFTVSAMTCLRVSFGHYELNTTGWGDNQPHTITLDAGYSNNGALYIAGTGKVVVNHTPAAYGGYDGYSGAVTVTNTATLAINAGKQLTSGTITFAAGTTLEVPSSGVETGALAFSGEGTVTLKVSDVSLADGDYVLVSSTAELPAGVAARFAVDAPTESRTYLYTLDNRSLRLAVGDEAILALPCIWTGAAGDGKMDTAGNWFNDRKPEAVGAAVLIPSEAATIDNNISGFAPSSITFGNGSGAVTIAGNPITGVAAITNLTMTASHTIDAPVYFVGDIQVKQPAMAEVGDLAKSHVTFAGGAYAAPGYAIENGNSTAVYSRCMYGKYYLASTASSPWAASVQGSGKRHCLGDNSTLYVPYAGRMTELYIGSGSKVDVGAMVNDNGRVSYRNCGEMVVTNLTLTGTGDRFTTHNQTASTSVPPIFKFERIETAMTVNWFYFCDNAVATKEVYYIGAGGLNFSSASATGAYCLGKEAEGDAQTLRPWYSDFTIGDRGNGTACFVMNRDVTFCTDDESGTGRTITLDAITRGNGTAPTITVSGSGTLRVNKAAINTTQPPVVVTNTATLAIKPGASLTTSALTLNSGTTLRVAESGTVALGGDLTLKAGAMLGFNYTTKDAPVLNLTGKTVTFDEGTTTNVVVNISSTNGKCGRGGAWELTSGGKFADATVSLAEGYPDWVKGISVNADGNIVIDVKFKGTYIYVK